jgi:hypothetical protein
MKPGRRHSMAVASRIEAPGGVLLPLEPRRKPGWLLSLRIAAMKPYRFRAWAMLWVKRATAVNAYSAACRGKR